MQKKTENEEQVTFGRRSFLTGAAGLAAMHSLPLSAMEREAKVPALHTVFHVDLSDAHPAKGHYIVAGRHRLPLHPHTQDTYAAALQEAPHLVRSSLPIRHTHFTVLPHPLVIRSVMRVHVRHVGQPWLEADHGVSHAAMVYPGVGGVMPAAAQDDAEDKPPTCHAGLDYYATAQCFLFHHPEVTSLKAPLVRAIHEYLDNDDELVAFTNQLALYMRKMGPPSPTAGWARLTPYTIPDADPNLAAPYKNRLTMQPTPEFEDQARPALSRLLLLIKNDRRFKDAKWNFQQGRSTVTSGRPVMMASSAYGPARLLNAAFRPARSSEPASQQDAWTAAVCNTDMVHGLSCQIEVADSESRKLNVTLQNSFVRCLGAYVRFFDAHGNAIPYSDWHDLNPGLANAPESFQTHDVRYLGYLPAINTILAIPVFSQPGTIYTKLTFPPNAVSASIYGGGMGVGEKDVPEATIIGGILTGLLNFAIPTFLLGFEVAVQSSKPLYDLVNDGLVTKIALAAGLWYLDAENRDGVDWRSLTNVSKVLFGVACRKLLVYCEGEAAAVDLAEQIPFAGWVLIAVNVLAGAAQMAETITEVATSPWLIEQRIATTITTTAILNHDPRNLAFPQGSARSYRVKMIYKDQGRPTVTSPTVAIPDAFTESSVKVLFPGNTLGGDIRFEAEFYIGDWVAGRATTGWIPNDEVHAKSVSLHLVQRPIPLTSETQYSHRQILQYDNGAYHYVASRIAPTETRFNLNTQDDPSQHPIGSLTGLTLSQRYGMLGISWQGAGNGIPACDLTGSGQTYAFANLSIPGTPMRPRWISGCGMQGRTRLIYDSFPPRYKMDASGNWVVDGMQNLVPDPTDKKLGDYYVDTSKEGVSYKEGQGYHLRRLSLEDGSGFALDQGNRSYGRFAYFPDSVAIHPAGYIVAVNSQYHKLQVVRLENAPRMDPQVPLGRIGSGRAEDPTREGLMFRPLACACASDGTILVLEENRVDAGNGQSVVARISAYDLYMNPVRRFVDSNRQPSYWLYLDRAASFTLLDMTAVGDEKTTYLYVLYYENDGRSPSDYKMAIYAIASGPTSTTPLLTVQDCAAGKIAVDMWHTAYTLNFAPVKDAQGRAAGPTMPSVSMWLADPPKGSSGRA